MFTLRHILPFFLLPCVHRKGTKVPSCGHTTPHTWAEPCQRCPLPCHTILGLGVSGRDVPSPACLSPGIRRTGTSTVSLPVEGRDKTVTPLSVPPPSHTHKGPLFLAGTPGDLPAPAPGSGGPEGAVQGGFEISKTVLSCSSLPSGQLRTGLLPTAGQHLPRHGSLQHTQLSAALPALIPARKAPRSQVRGSGPGRCRRPP